MQGSEVPFTPSLSSHLGPRLRDDARHASEKCLVRVYKYCGLQYIEDMTLPAPRDLSLNHYSPMGDPLLSAANPRLPESLDKTRRDNETEKKPPPFLGWEPPPTTSPVVRCSARKLRIRIPHRAEVRQTLGNVICSPQGSA